MRLGPQMVGVVLFTMAVAGSAPGVAGDARPSPAAAAEFENSVRPLLQAKCVKCHGSKKQESNLRLDRRDGMMQGGDSGPAIVPGKPDESLLVKAVRHEGDVRMPPRGKLKDAEIATLSRWIADGALWPDEAVGASVRRGEITDDDRAFWSLQPIAAPPAPAVRDPSRARNAIDDFILAKLEVRRLSPAPPADKRTLIRRATFDLTGLPPTVDDVNAFLADESPGAFARVVDRLLASPSYGERWGRQWLDVVRYADTAGETADYPVREAVKYRDYVIDAFNHDKPYDEFVREQIAGDLLALDGPVAKYAERVKATGFLAISRRFGFDSENYHHLTIQDTIDTMGQAFLGLSIGCARCHDHKFDPISARDYYALYGIFESTRYPFAGSEQKGLTRSMAALEPPDQSARRREAYAGEIARIELELERLKAPRPRIRIRDLDDLDGDFELQAPANGGSQGSVVPPWLADGHPEATAPSQSPYTNLTFRTGTTGVHFPAGAAEHRISQTLRTSRNAKTHDRVYLNLDLRTASPMASPSAAYRLALRHRSSLSCAVEVEFESTKVSIRNGERFEGVAALAPGTWYNLQLILDLDDRTCSGSIGVPGHESIFTNEKFSSGWDGTVDEIVVETYREGPRSDFDIDNIAVRDTPIPSLSADEAKAGETQASTNPDRSAAERAELERRHAAMVAEGPCALAYAVADGTPHDARIQKRGEPTKPGDVVPRRFLEILGGDSLPSGIAESGRRQLAEWLTRPSNPLTARVMVNRIWKGHFGNGLVATENDFGRRGKRPSHPELLDALARQFVSDAWSIKAMHRRIMLSATYQLASTFDQRGFDVDPENELFWRFPRQRLDAESLRDTLLTLGGKLDRSRGSHPFPPVGAVFTQHAPFIAVYETNRRSVYLMTQRIKRHPYLALFDGADPNATTAKRSNTTVPTQALFFLNDPFVHDQSAGLARRLIAGASDDARRIRFAFETVLTRAPEGHDLAHGNEFLQRYRRGLESAGVPPDQRDVQLWSAYVRTLFASNEFLYID